MLPIKDTIRSRSFPLITWLIIIANGLVFFYELSLPEARLEQFVMTFGLVPDQVQLLNPLTWFPFFSHMWLHGGWLHFLSNLWTFFIFADNVEDRLGPGRFLFFYILGGFAAGLLQVLMSPGSNVPAVGASGAIAAVLGAYFLFYPGARVITLIPVFIIPWFIQIPAWVFLGVWFVTQLFSGVAALTAATAVSGGIAWWAHIGGFVFGLAAAKLFERRQRPRDLYPDEYYPY